MQRCNERMAMNIRRMFVASSVGLSIGFDRHGGCGYEKGNVWQSFIRVNVKDKQNIRIPLFLLGYYSLIRLLTRHSIKDMEEIVVPVNYPPNPLGSLRSGDSIMRNFSLFCNTHSNTFSYIDTSKGNSYYGCRGAIFNSDRKPLFMPVVSCCVLDATNLGDRSIRSQLSLNDLKVYIHPSVFYVEGLMEKCIVNKILPFILSHRISVSVGGFRIPYDSPLNIGIIPEIVVKDISEEFFCNTLTPNDVPSEEELDQLLLDHIDEVDNAAWEH